MGMGAEGKFAVSPAVRGQWLQRLVSAVWHPLAYDWAVTLFSFGYSLVLIMMGANALHLGVFKGPMVVMFTTITVLFAGTMLVSSVVGLVGLYRLDKKMRMRASMALALSYGWVVLYYINAVPLPWQGVFVYAAHSVMEAVVYLRTATDPRHLWDRTGE